MQSDLRHELSRAMSVSDLIQQLQQMDPDAHVLFVCSYGDYHNTQQALPVGELQERSSQDIKRSAYSQSEMALEDSGDHEFYCEKCELERNHGEDTGDGYLHCHACDTVLIGEDGEKVEADDDEETNVVILSM